MSEKNEYKKNLEFFRKNLNGFLDDPIYKGKYLIIHGEKVQGLYDTFSTAFENAVPKFPQGEFIIQAVIGENEQISFLRSAI